MILKKDIILSYSMSGVGATTSYIISSLQLLHISLLQTQVLVLTHTRDYAISISQVNKEL